MALALRIQVGALKFLVVVKLREPVSDELCFLTQLCLRSKAYWGYDEEFMRLCEPELSLTEADLEEDAFILAVDAEEPIGIVQVSNGPDGCYLEKLFVEPEHMGRGIGRLLFGWATKTATDLGVNEMIVEADPGAAQFYESMGCIEVGQVISGSIPGRTIPKFTVKLL
jgi:GNAT superfamily N-acetyltransferase